MYFRYSSVFLFLASELLLLPSSGQAPAPALAGRGEPTKDYKELNPNILSLVFVSYNRIQIVQKAIRNNE